MHWILHVFCVFSLRLFECLHCARLWHISGTLQDFCFVLVVVAVEQGPENDCAHFLINRPLHCRLASRWFTSLSLFGCGIFVCLVVFVFVYLWCWCHHDILRNRGHFIDFPLDNLFWNKINSAKNHKKIETKVTLLFAEGGSIQPLERKIVLFEGIITTHKTFLFILSIFNLWYYRANTWEENRTEIIQVYWEWVQWVRDKETILITNFAANVSSAKGPRHPSNCVTENLSKSSNRSKSPRLVSYKSRIAILPEIHAETKPWTSFSWHVTSPCSNLAKCATRGRHGFSDHLESTPPKSVYFQIKHFVQRSATIWGSSQNLSQTKESSRPRAGRPSFEIDIICKKLVWALYWLAHHGSNENNLSSFYIR